MAIRRLTNTMFVRTKYIAKIRELNWLVCAHRGKVPFVYNTGLLVHSDGSFPV